MNNIIISGASSDIGIEIIRNFADKYDTVWAHYRTINDDLKEEAEKHPNIKLLKADYMVDSDIRNMLDEINKDGHFPNTIVHLPAMKYQLNNFVKTSSNYYEDSYKISVMSIVEILKEFLPRMTKSDKESRIMFMLSACTIGNPPSFSSVYTTVKYALLGLMKELAVEYSRFPIYINGLSPEMVETKFLTEIPRLIVQKNSKDMPHGRNLLPADLMQATKNLLFDVKETGQNIHITL